MPKRAIALLLACAACAGEAAQPTAAGEACVRGDPPADLDLTAGVWRQLTAPHGIGRDGLLYTVDAVVASCDAIVSVAHDPGPGGKAVAPSNPQMMWSPDGTTWRSYEMAEDGWYRDIAFGEGTWVAVGSRMGGGVISMAKSTDLSAWTDVFQHSAAFRAVAYGAGKFVAVTEGGVAVSSDGQTFRWASRPSVQALYQDVAYGAGRFVVAGVGATLHSTDAEHWDLAGCGPSGCAPILTPTGPSETKFALQEVHFTAGAFYAFGASGQMRSTDGIDFLAYEGTHVPNAALSGRLLSSTANPNGDMRGMLAGSNDGGVTWTALPLATEVVATADCSSAICVAANNALLVFTPH